MMSFATSRRRKGLRAQVCGVVTVLALVVAPACAPLCAVKVCSQTLGTDNGDSPCHVMKIAGGSATQVHGAQSCGVPDLPAATLNSTNKHGSRQDERFETFGVVLDTLSQKVSSAPEQLQDDCFACKSSPHTSSSLFLTSVLRI